MSPEQCALILALMADLRLTVERLAAENAELRRQLATTTAPPEDSAPAHA
jgi:hypothetical protein